MLFKREGTCRRLSASHPLRYEPGKMMLVQPGAASVASI